MHDSRTWNRSGFAFGALALCASLAACGGGGGGGGNSTPAISTSPAAVAFDSSFVGETYTKTLTIQNPGSAALSVSAITLTDSTPTQDYFSIAHPSLPLVVIAGGTADMTVTLQRKTHAPPTGSIAIASNDPAHPTLTVPIGGTDVDQAATSLCVLIGQTVIQGCDIDPANGNAPRMELGTVNKGETVSKTIAIWNTGAGNVPVAVSAVDFDPPQATPSNYAVSLFTLDALGAEVPVALPAYLNPPNPATGAAKTELRARVTFTANVPSGGIAGVNVVITSTHPSGSTAIPITATVAGCPTGFADCDNDPTNGCEVNTSTDLANCGGCGAACSNQNAAPTCDAGTCNLHCKNDVTGNFADCDGNKANGCEVNLAADINHCGACTTVCNSNHATPFCANNLCGIQTCESGWANCDGVVTNGCETSTTQVTNCGACNNNCNNYTPPNVATKTCIPGAGGAPWQCAVGTCNAGYTDMDKNFSDGCECRDEGFGKTCAQATAAGPYGLGSTNTVAGNITPLSDTDYVAVTFSASASCPTYHPIVTISGDPAIYFDVIQADCQTAMPCLGSESNVALKTWETTQSVCGQAGNSSYTAAGSIGVTYVLKIYTVASTASTCLPYTVTITD